MLSDNAIDIYSIANRKHDCGQYGCTTAKPPNTTAVYRTTDSITEH
jgi:hypothetical protein